MFFRKLIIVGILFVLTSSCKAEGILEKVIHGKREEQKNAVTEILKNPQKYKHEIIKYLTKKRNWKNKTDWPSENVLYLVGVLRDKTYRPILLSYLQHDMYCNDLRMEYAGGLKFALTLLISQHEIRLIDNSPNSDAQMFIKEEIKWFYNAKSESIEDRRKWFERESVSSSSHEYQEFYKKIAELSLEKILEIIKNDHIDVNKRDSALSFFSISVEDKKYIPELLILSMQLPRDGADTLIRSCLYGIYNIFIQNGENK